MPRLHFVTQRPPHILLRIRWLPELYQHRLVHYSKRELEITMDNNARTNADDVDSMLGPTNEGQPTGAGYQQAGIVDQRAAADPVMADRCDAGISRTYGERQAEDGAPPITATASFESGFAPVGATQADAVLVWSQEGSRPPTEIATLRSLAAALADSIEAYEEAAREGEEFFRSIFLRRSKERRDMVNEFSARILALGNVIEGESDYIPGFASSVVQTNSSGGFVLNVVEEHEAIIRSLFLTAMSEQGGETKAFLSAQYLVIQRSEEELRDLRSEIDPRST